MVKAKLFILSSILAVVCCSGCAIIGLMGTPTNHEKKIPAGFLIDRRTKVKVLVMVENSQAGRGDNDLNNLIAMAINANLVKKSKLKEKYIVPQSGLKLLREDSDFEDYQPEDIAKKLGADLVLYVLVEDFDLVITQGTYGNGSLVTRSFMFDGATGRKVWPSSGDGSNCSVKVQIEAKGRFETIKRLVSATGHCVGRNFYNCPKDEYRVADEVFDFDSDKWE